MRAQLAKDAFGELLIRRVRDPQVEQALAHARALGDDGTAAVAAIDMLLAEFLHMLEEPAWGAPGAWRSVPLRVLVGAPADGPEAPSQDDMMDLAASSDGLVGDLLVWIERFSDFPQTPAFEPVGSFPANDLEFRRAVRGVVKSLVSGETTHPALDGIYDLALPPGGAIFPELHESLSPDGRPCWIGRVRLFRQTPTGRSPLDLVAWLEVIEDADSTVEARIINVLEEATPPAPEDPRRQASAERSAPPAPSLSEMPDG